LHAPAQHRFQSLDITALAAFADCPEVSASTESAAGAGDHHYIDALIFGDPAERFR